MEDTSITTTRRLAMSAQPKFQLGQIALFPFRPTTGRPQLGGRRPPHYSRGTRRIPAHSRRRQSLSDWLRLTGAVAASTTIASSIALAQPAPENLPNLSGTYRCEGDQTTC